MAISFVQQNQAQTNSGVTTQAVSFLSNTTSGNLILAIISTDVTGSAYLASVTDSQSNVYSELIKATDPNSNSEINIWYAINITGGVTPTVTATFSKTLSYRPNMQIAEYAGLDTVQPVDFAIASPIVPTAATPNIIIDYPTDTKTVNELIICTAEFNDNSSTWVVGTGYSNLLNQAATTTGNQATESKVVAAQGAQQGTLKISTSINKGLVVLVGLADITLPNTFKKMQTNNYQFVKVGNGMSVSEKIR